MRLNSKLELIIFYLYLKTKKYTGCVEVTYDFTFNIISNYIIYNFLDLNKNIFKKVQTQITINVF